MIALLLLAAQIPGVAVRSVEIPAQTDKPVLVQCPVDRDTRIVLPERLTRVTASAGSKEALGIAIERYQPEGVVLLHPRSHPANGRLELRGPTMRILLQIESVATGVASELRLALTRPDPITPSAVASSEVGAEGTATAGSLPSSAPPVVPTPETVAPAGAQQAGEAHMRPTPDTATAEPGEDELTQLSEADHVAIGRREGLPGQKEVVLVDALRSPEWLWLRFVVRGGSAEQVKRVALGEREVTSYTARPEARDLRVTVRLARADVGRKARVSLALESGARYTFPLTSSSFTAFVRGLFK